MKANWDVYDGGSWSWRLGKGPLSVLLFSNVVICSKLQGLFTAIDKHYGTGIPVWSLRGIMQFISAADFECIGLTFWSEFRSSKSQCQKSSCIHSQILPCIWSETSTKAKAAANNKFNNVRTGGPWSGGKLWREKQAWPQWTGSQSGDSNTWNSLCPTATDSHFPMSPGIEKAIKLLPLPHLLSPRASEKC